MNFGRAPRSSPSRRLRTVLPVAVAAGALTLSACGGGGTSGGGGKTGFVSNTGGIATVAKADRRSVNDLSGETLEGKKLDVADYKGKVVVLNVWGSWCGPCLAEAPHFAKVSKELAGKGVAFIGINTRDLEKEPAVKFEQDFGITYPSLYDPAGKLLVYGFPKGSLNPQAIPSTIVLDRNGKIAARSLKAVDEEQLRKLIDPLIAEK
ncbi:TlpA family protein disulfide reductase [Streptomyces liangshanensis]|uniref:TlpA family protein disulfide reductase n=1 Tax=Streptomyces liangshanensis TaxID=2717324 RepID=UPI0036D9D17B